MRIVSIVMRSKIARISIRKLAQHVGDPLLFGTWNGFVEFARIQFNRRSFDRETSRSNGVVRLRKMNIAILLSSFRWASCWDDPKLGFAQADKGRALDKVAHFHLGNGAVVERPNWLGDTSANGFKQSYAMMVNYRYRLSDVDANHEAYAAGKVVASRDVRAQAKG